MSYVVDLFLSHLSHVDVDWWFDSLIVFLFLFGFHCKLNLSSYLVNETFETLVVKIYIPLCLFGCYFSWEILLIYGNGFPSVAFDCNCELWSWLITYLYDKNWFDKFFMKAIMKCAYSSDCMTVRMFYCMESEPFIYELKKPFATFYYYILV
jgi:hypothetical protein